MSEWLEVPFSQYFVAPSKKYDIKPPEYIKFAKARDAYLGNYIQN